MTKHPFDYFPDPPAGRRTCQLGFVLIDGFSSLCVSAMINPLRSANRELRYRAYSWDFLALNDDAITASDATLAKATLPLRTERRFDYLFVCSGIDTNPPERERINAALQRLSRQTRVFGSLCTGAFMLARAGFLDNKRFTMHWENIPAFSEEFPNLDVQPNLYIMDGNFWSGSGGLSSMDLALSIIAQDHDHRIASAVANQYQIDRVRPPDLDQRPFALEVYDTLPQNLQRAVSAMMVNMEIPLAVPEIAKTAGMTVRSLERGFQRHVGQSPARFYRKIRLNRARQLLWHSNLSILEVAILTGFPSPSHLSRLYQEQFGMRPSAERKPRGTGAV